MPSQSVSVNPWRPQTEATRLSSVLEHSARTELPTGHALPIKHKHSPSRRLGTIFTHLKILPHLDKIHVRAIPHQLISSLDVVSDYPDHVLPRKVSTHKMIHSHLARLCYILMQVMAIFPLYTLSLVLWPRLPPRQANKSSLIKQF